MIVGLPFRASTQTPFNLPTKVVNDKRRLLRLPLFAEPAYLAKHAFQLAQLFNNFYHRHRILTEADLARRQFLLATAAVAERALVRSLAWLGIAVPEAM
jgi:arginyl-tRNA synthetase